MIVFHKVKLHNFLSFKDQEFEFKEGIHLVLGENKDSEVSQSNGAGKSSLFYSVVYALYGKSDRNLQRRNTDDTYVELLFYVDDLEVKIRRYYNHKKHKNKLLIFVNDEEKTFHTQKQAQEYLQRLITYPYEHFISSVILLQGMPVRILSLSPTKRKDYFLSMISYDFDKIQEKIKKDIEILKLKEAEINQELSKLMSDISFKEGKLSAILSLVEVNKSEDEKKLKELNLKLKNINQQLKDYPKIKEDLENKHKELKKLELEINLLSKKKQDFIEIKEKGICPLCNSKVDNVFDKKIENLTFLISNLSEKLEAISKEIKSLEKDLKERELLLSEKQYIEQEIKNLLKSLSNQNQKSQITFIEADLKKLYSQKERLEDELFKIQDDIKNLQILYDLFKPSGEIRSIVLSSYLDIFNDVLSSYLLYLYPELTDLELTLDDKQQQIVLKGVDYHSLSGGEKRRLDLVFQLAFSEFISLINKISTNLLVLDEVFDGIDYKAVSNILSFITSNYENKSIYVITHNENIKQFFSSVIKIQKQNSISSVIS